jgi:hypothetical protein
VLPRPRCIAAVITLSTLFLPVAVRSQSRFRAPERNSFAERPIPNCVPTPLNDVELRPALVSASCVGPIALPATNTPSTAVLPAVHHTADFPEPDPVVAELAALGKRGRVLSATRDAVLSILEGTNACSAWFLGKNPDSVAMFRSLHIAIDSVDPGFVRKTNLSATDHIYTQPYVARAQQNVGPGSVITVNQRGAFFEDAGGVIEERGEGGPAKYEPPRLLRVANYRGATQPARVLTILHEFGHIIDLLPLDAGVPFGPEISMRNSALVVDHCKREVESAGKKSDSHQSASAAAPSASHPLAAFRSAD